MSRNTKLLLAATAAAAFCALAANAQTPTPPEPSGDRTGQEGGGWRRFDDSAQKDRDAAGAPTRRDVADDNRANEAADRDADQTRNSAPGPYVRPPAQIIVPAGTFLSIRVNQPVSSDRNYMGDQFTASLSQPVVADGFVIARRGQTIGGRVAEAVRAGRIKGTSRLAMELTELSLVDGRQMPIRTQLIQYAGGTSLGRDATTIGTTTGMGAVIGAAANGGAGAGAGAAAGAAASVIGVLLTRGRATEVDTETELTFRTLDPLTISTERTEQAFQSTQQGDYEPRRLQRRAQVQQGPGWGYPGGWGGGWGGWGGPGWGWPYYYGGPRLLIYSGRGFYSGRGGFYSGRGGFSGRGRR